jgi:Co/Zn/Cd efflux system component
MKESIKLPVVLIVSLLLIFLQTAGAFYSKSLALFSYAGFIIINAFSLLLKFANNETDKSFRKALFIAAILNIFTLFILALIIINKAHTGILSPKIINTQIAAIITITVAVGLVACFFIGRQFIFTALMSSLIIIGFSEPIFKRIALLDYYLSAFFAVLIMIKAILSIKNFAKMLKSTRDISVLSLKNYNRQKLNNQNKLEKKWKLFTRS